jgi:hypothetical protein
MCGFHISELSIHWKKLHQPSFYKMNSSFNHIDKVFRTSNYSNSREKINSQSYKDNNNKHEGPSVDVYIISHKPPRRGHILKRDKKDELERLHNLCLSKFP